METETVDAVRGNCRSADNEDGNGDLICLAERVGVDYERAVVEWQKFEIQSRTQMLRFQQSSRRPRCFAALLSELETLEEQHFAAWDRMLAEQIRVDTFCQTAGRVRLLRALTSSRMVGIPPVLARIVVDYAAANRCAGVVDAIVERNSMPSFDDIPCIHRNLNAYLADNIDLTRPRLPGWQLDEWIKTSQHPGLDTFLGQLVTQCQDLERDHSEGSFFLD
jgi:hypothetical protein